jgi:hypothetical protein
VAVDPAATEAVNVVKVGAADADPAASTSNCKELDVPPPGAGDCTVMAVFPALAMSAAGTCAASCVALTNCVVSAVVPQ